MNTVIAVKGLKAHVHIDHGVNTTTAWGILFDEDADIVAETESKRYSGFCDSEIVYDLAGELMFSRRGIEYSDIPCDCECDV